MWDFITEHWVAVPIVIVYTIVVLFIALFAGFNQLY